MTADPAISADPVTPPGPVTRADPVTPPDPWRQRIRLEHQIHDGPALRLSALTLRLGLLRHRTDDPTIREGLQDAQDELDAVLGELRSVASQLYPPLLDEAGLGPALRQVAERVPATVDVVADDHRFGHALEGAVFFAVVEFLAALPTDTSARVEVAIRREHDQLVLAVTGPGGDPSAPAAARLAGTARALGGAVEPALDQHITDPQLTHPQITMRIPCA